MNNGMSRFLQRKYCDQMKSDSPISSPLNLAKMVLALNAIINTHYVHFQEPNFPQIVSLPHELNSSPRVRNSDAYLLIKNNAKEAEELSKIILYKFMHVLPDLYYSKGKNVCILSPSKPPGTCDLYFNVQPLLENPKEFKKFIDVECRRMILGPAALAVGGVSLFEGKTFSFFQSIGLLIVGGGITRFDNVYSRRRGEAIKDASNCIPLLEKQISQFIGRGRG